MEDEITGIFLEILMVCQEMTLIGGEFFAIDGCKLPSNASKESSGTFEDLKKKTGKVELPRFGRQVRTCVLGNTQVFQFILYGRVIFQGRVTAA